MKADRQSTTASGEPTAPDNPAGTDTSIAGEREAMLQQRRGLRAQRKELKNRANRTSRLIGEARREGRDFEDLKSTMRACGRELKVLDARLKETNDRIERLAAAPAPAASTATRQDPARKPVERYRPASLDDDARLTIRRQEENGEAWNAYCAGHPAATLHHRHEWRSILERAYGLESHFLSARMDGRIVGILPLVRHTSRLFGDFLVSMPWFASGGAIGDHARIEQKLMEAAGELGNELGVGHIEFRDTIPRDTWPAQTHKVNMVLELPDTSEQLWQGFTSKLRAQVRRPQRENPEVVFGGTELLNDFYRVYARNMRDLGSPLHSAMYVRTILEQFPRNTRLVVVRMHGRPVGGGFLLGTNRSLEIPLASTIRDVNPLGMNMLMYWEVLQYAIEHGYRYFDFGRSTRDAGTYRFKKQWGAVPQPLYWHYWLKRGREMPSLSPDNPKYAVAVATWKRLPVWFTSRLGTMLMKHVP